MLLVMLAEKSIVWSAVGQAEMISLSSSANPSEHPVGSIEDEDVQRL